MLLCSLTVLGPEVVSVASSKQVHVSWGTGELSVVCTEDFLLIFL